MLGKRNPAGEGGYDQDGDQLASDGHSLVGAQLPVLSQASLVVIRIYGSDVPSLRLGTGSGQENRGPRAAHSTPLLFWASAVGTQRENGAGQGVSTAREQTQHSHGVSVPRQSAHTYGTGSGSIWPSLHTAATEQLQGCG